MDCVKYVERMKYGIHPDYMSCVINGSDFDIIDSGISNSRLDGCWNCCNFPYTPNSSVTEQHFHSGTYIFLYHYNVGTGANKNDGSRNQDNENQRKYPKIERIDIRIIICVRTGLLANSNRTFARLPGRNTILFNPSPSFSFSTTAAL